jgi:hypothetical protein
MANVFRNESGFFKEDRLTGLDEYPEWELDDEVEESRAEIEELFEKRESMLTEELDEKETQYYWTSYVFRALGYCFSVVELTPESVESEDGVRPDFTLFGSSQAFEASKDDRGNRKFFKNALATARGIGWDDSLEEIEDEDGQVKNPALAMDKYLRATGVEWGILTNGRLWRLYHRESAGLLDTFFELDLVESLNAADTDAFKYFWLLFGPVGLGGDGEVEPLVQRLRR